MIKRDSHRADHLLHNNGLASKLKDIILGGQDGVVNVLGLVLGVASATNDPKIVIIAGIASTFAESISMGAVAYTSTQAAQAYYKSLEQKELHEIQKHPTEERAELKYIFAKKGLKGKLLAKIVERISSSKRRWLLTMMSEELNMSAPITTALSSALIVFAASMIGSIIPIIPFFLMPIIPAMIASVIVCSIVLFLTGAYKAKLTIGTWWKSGLAMMLIGMISALAGYAIGSLLGVAL